MDVVLDGKTYKTDVIVAVYVDINYVLISLYNGENERKEWVVRREIANLIADGIRALPDIPDWQKQT